MKKKIPSWGILALVCLIVAGVLSVVSCITDEPIALRAQEKAFAARQEAFALADEFVQMELEDGCAVDACYEAYKAGKLVGYVAQITVSGCQGPIEIQAGFDLDGEIQAISCGGQKFSETSGLGAKVKEHAFRDQFSGLAVPVALGETIDAVTGATISSTAVVDGVNAAGDFVGSLLCPSV
ncbi:MAG: FMN-binding protein [Eubacteriales bacterium]|nr:FMN-binding protein [Eubacteriales bacterium]